MSSRGLRNHNPGNIKDFGIDWDGTASFEQRTPEQRAEETFVVFRAPWYGIRAMAKILRNYQTRHGLNTVGRIIDRWAPPSDDNPTSDYSQFVADSMEIGRHYPINLSNFETMLGLCCAIIEFENGENPYTWELNTGLIMAGIEPEVRKY